MKNIEGQFQIKKKWFNNKGTFKLEQQPKKVVGTFTYGKIENKIDMGRISGDHYFEFCGSYKTKFGMKYYSVTANVEGNKFDGNFENKRGVKKIVGTFTSDAVVAAPVEVAPVEVAPVEAAPAAAPAVEKKTEEKK